MNRFFLIIALLLLLPEFCFAHGGVTPYDVLGNMKRQGSGPYAMMGSGGGSFAESWLGFQGKDTEQGMRIVGLKENAPLAEASLRKGDIIFGVNGKAINNLADLDQFMQAISKPDVFTFHYLREGDEESENIYLDGSLAEVDPEMNTLLGKQGGFKPGMLMDDMMARSPLGGMKKGGFVPPMMRKSGQQQGGFTPPIFRSSSSGSQGKQSTFGGGMAGGGGRGMSPSVIMQQMMGQTPMGNRSQNRTPTPTTTAPYLHKQQAAPSHPEEPTIKQGIAILETELAALPDIISRWQALGLTRQQVAQLKAIESEHRKFAVKNDAKLSIARLDLNDLLRQPRVPQQQALQMVNRINEAKKERSLYWLQLWQQMNHILQKK